MPCIVALTIEHVDDILLTVHLIHLSGCRDHWFPLELPVVQCFENVYLHGFVFNLLFSVVGVEFLIDPE